MFSRIKDDGCVIEGGDAKEAPDVPRPDTLISAQVRTKSEIDCERADHKEQLNAVLPHAADFHGNIG
jgi:hypothetical protein